MNEVENYSIKKYIKIIEKHLSELYKDRIEKIEDRIKKCVYLNYINRMNNVCV